MVKYILINVTFNNLKEAKKISKILLNNRLVSCVQIIPKIISLYWWKNEIQESEEYLCIYKTKSFLFKKIENIILENHSYEVPEIISIKLSKCNKKYLNWIDEYTKIL